MSFASVFEGTPQVPKVLGQCDGGMVGSETDRVIKRDMASAAWNPMRKLNMPSDGCNLGVVLTNALPDDTLCRKASCGLASNTLIRLNCSTDW
jgi:hypothetical protein